MRKKYFNGEIDSPEYYAWKHMKQRCYNPNVSNYHNYGGRGIIVCERWLYSFKNFLGRKPRPELTLERIDNDGDYKPDNCEWATRADQAHNQSTTKLTKTDACDIPNSPLTAKELAVKYNVTRELIYRVRNHKAWLDEDLPIGTPLKWRDLFI
jgi:hypothetical protein